jgi:hypothetical protein
LSKTRFAHRNVLPYVVSLGAGDAPRLGEMRANATSRGA